MLNKFEKYYKHDMTNLNLNLKLKTEWKVEFHYPCYLNREFSSGMILRVHKKGNYLVPP